MNKRVLLLGGYGTFGALIARRLIKEPGLSLIVAGRSGSKASAFANEIGSDWAELDIKRDLDAPLKTIRPDIIIHTSGPFQEQGYQVAHASIRNRIHYLDLADGRDFVSNIGRLDAEAKEAGVLIVSGASTVPGLTSAVLRNYANEFESLDTIDFGIATAQRTNRGLATVRAVLGYAGKPFKTIVDGRIQSVYGWQDLCWRKFPGIGWRLLANCDVPDLELFPKYFPDLKTVRFRAGLELPLLQLGLWALSWLVRGGVLSNLDGAAPALLHVSRWFDAFGTNDSGFFMEMHGRGASQEAKIVFRIIARAGDGLLIPCTPAILLAVGLVNGTISHRGAMPCIGLITLDGILRELAPLQIISQIVRLP